MAKNKERKKSKFYVVWKGYQPGVYDSWATCQKQINGFQGALFKGYATRIEAERHFMQRDDIPIVRTRSMATRSRLQRVWTAEVEKPALAVDAACNMRTGVMEFRGVDVHTRRVVFSRGPYYDTTNNVGEFLALVLGLMYLNHEKMPPECRHIPIYTDSVTAMSWVRHKQAKTTMVRTPANEKLFEIIYRAECWLKQTKWHNRILKWDTVAWGEIPADYGRK